MHQLLIVAVLGLAAGQPLFYRPQQKIKEKILDRDWRESSSAIKASQVDWVMKQSAIQLKDVPCGESYFCPDGTKCCPQPTGGYGCCLLSYPVCCSDGLHCCPQGTICDVSTGTCNAGVQQTDWVVKQSAKQLNNVPCGGSYFCPDGTKCCPRPTGDYGCCDLSYPVCCSDGLHCCPQGTTCDVSTGTCNTGVQQIDWMVKQSAKQLNNVPCGEGYFCSDGYNCCPIPSGGYGCCPVVGYPVCCSDGLHCCPQDTTCDPTSTLCNKGNLQFGSSLKIPARRFDNIICPDGQSSCPSDNTCCKLPSGTYGCCPFPSAVCCEDKAHCCPKGETCDLSAGTCKKEVFIEWIMKAPAVKITMRKTEKILTP